MSYAVLSILWCSVIYHSLGWLDRCTSMGKGMGHCMCIAHVYLYRIVPRWSFKYMNSNVWTCYEYNLYAMMLSIWYDEVWMCIVSWSVDMRALLISTYGLIYEHVWHYVLCERFAHIYVYTYTHEWWSS